MVQITSVLKLSIKEDIIPAFERQKCRRVGIRAHDLGRFQPLELARRVAELGADSVQLALGKAISGMEMRPGAIDPSMARQIGAAFQSCNVSVDVLGCYVNPIHPDHLIREEGLLLFQEHLLHAREFGCNMVALESGSLDADYSAHPGNESEGAFSRLVESLDQLLEVAELTGTFVGIEAVASHVISTPARMLQLLETLSSPRLRVVLDPVNLLTPSNHQSQRKIVERCFEWFGDRIEVIHVKDFVIEGGRLRIVPAGEGILDHDFVLSCAMGCGRAISFIIEEAGPETVRRCIRFIRGKNRSISK